MSSQALRAESGAAVPLFDRSSLPLEALLEAQAEIIDLMASGAPLRDVLTHIAQLVEALAPPALCSILLLHPDGKHLKPAAAPSLPEEFTRTIDGLEIGPVCGSCGTAAWRKEPVIVSDIASDPLWAIPRDFVLSFGLRACWSQPIVNAEGTVLGTIAMYYREPRAPTARDWGLLEPASRLVRLALAQNRKEEELGRSEARWHLAADAAGLGTYDVDFITGETGWSPQMKSMLGFPQSVKGDVILFKSVVHPDDLQPFEDTFGPLAGEERKRVRSLELRVRRFDTGEQRIMVLKGRVLLNDRGEVARAIGTLSDITEQRRREMELRDSEARWSIAAEATNIGTFDVELPINADVWSVQFKRILGLSEDTKSDFERLVELTHPDDRPALRAFTRKSQGNPEALRHEELRIRRADTGEERIVSIKGRAICNAAGRPVRAIGTMCDITVERRRETELAEAKAAAEAANRAKSAFLASMSHELRTPLNAIIGFSDVIRQESLGTLSRDKYLEYIGDIHDSGLHLLSLINDVLDMAKIEAGKFELRPENLDIGGVAMSALRFVEPQAMTGGIALELEVEPGLELFADERAIRQILTNLLSNAVKFTKQGGRVTVFVRREATGNLALGVADTGRGMTEAGIKTALQPFGQVDQTITVEGRGTGLGLPIVKSLIEAHGGTIHVKSRLGEGTSVWGEFPRSLVSAAA